MLSKWLYCAIIEGSFMKISYDREREMKQQGRRDILKMMGAGSIALLTGVGTSASAKTTLSTFATRKRVDIVIAGGGTAGITAAARLRRSAPNAKITLVAPNTTHLYQSGQVYVAAGLYDEYDDKRQTGDLLPDNVEWLHDTVTAFFPHNNKILTENNGKIPYDYLIVALGCEYDYDSIEGLSISDIGKHGITSVYLNDQVEGTSAGAVVSNMWFKSIRSAAERSHPKILFADPHTPVKGENASLDMLFLLNDILKGNGLGKKGSDLRGNATLTMIKAEKTLFSSPAIDRALKKILKKNKNTQTLYAQRLISIDKEKKRALFSGEKGKSEISYDYIHITPPMRAPSALRNSELSIKGGRHQGWMEIDAQTLQHPTYSNVFGIGDVVGLDSGKSGAAIREQAILLQDNIAAIIEGNKPPLTYTGYSAAPIKTRYGRIMLAEYTPDGLAPTFPLDPTVPRWIWWEMDLHLLRKTYFDLMMRGMM